MTTSGDNGWLKITAAIRDVYENAGLDYASDGSTIVPLFDLISAYPIRVAQLRKRLTYRSAIEFLTAQTGDSIPLPADPDRALSGFLYVHEFAGSFYGCILTEKDDPIARRRFTAAHELGHYILHFLPLLKLGIRGARPRPIVLAEGISYTGESEAEADKQEAHLVVGRGEEEPRGPGGGRAAEQEANDFAAEILMPEGQCRALAERHLRQFGSQRGVVARCLATEFLVSQEAMRRRLIKLDILEKQAA